MINRRYKPECDDKPNKHSVLAFKDGKLLGKYETTKLASNELGLNVSAIQRSIRKVRPTKNGIFFFHYEDSYLWHDMMYNHQTCPEGYKDHRHDKKKKDLPLEAYKHNNPDGQSNFEINE